jgi:hypothetical protein
MQEGSVFEEVRSAVAALERIALDLDPALIDGPGAADLLEIFGRGERVCAAAKALLARRVDETGVWRGNGHRTAAHWVAEATGETVGAAARALETARALERLPETDAAFRAGQLSETQAAEITSAAGSDPQAEAVLLATAAETGVKGLRDRCREIRADAEENDQAWARRLHAQRRAHEWTDPDGTYRVEARLAPDAGARFSAAWKAHTDRVFQDARRAGRREPRAAYADALVALASEGPCKPVQISAVVDSAALARGHTEAGERCEISGVGHPHDSGEAAPGARGPRPDLPGPRMCERAVPRDRSHRPAGRGRPHRARQSVATLFAPSRSQDVLRLKGRRRERRSGSRPAR